MMKHKGKYFSHTKNLHEISQSFSFWNFGSLLSNTDFPHPFSKILAAQVAEYDKRKK